MAISVFCHPFCAGQVAIERSSCTSRFKFRINMEHKPGDLAPIRTLAVGVEQAQIGDDVFFVIDSKWLTEGSLISYIRVKGRLLHFVLRVKKAYRNGGMDGRVL
jgi:hypothetical protein